MRKHMKELIISIILGIIVILGSIGYFVTAAEFGDELVSIGASGKYNEGFKQNGYQEEKVYSYSGPTSVEQIQKELNDSFNNSTNGHTAEAKFEELLTKYANAFCGRHKKGITNAGGPVFQPKHGPSKNMNGYITFTKDLEDPAYPIFNSSRGKTQIFSDGYVYNIGTDTHTDPETYKTASNFNARILVKSGNLKNVSAGDISINNTNVVVYAATFTDKEAGEKYYTTDAQRSIWGVTGNPCNGCSEHSHSTKTYARYLAGMAVDNYEAELKAHKDKVEVTVQDGDKPGAYYMKNTNSYRVGPFYMSDYAYAYSSYVEGFSGSGLATAKRLIGGIESGKVILEDDSGKPIELEIGKGNVKIVYQDEKGNTVTQLGDRNRSGSHTQKMPASEYPYPFPNSKFYIDIPRQNDSNGLSLKEFNFVYRKTECSGTGSILIVRAAQTSWTMNKGGANGCSLIYDSCKRRVGHCTDSCEPAEYDENGKLVTPSEHHDCTEPPMYCRHWHTNCGNCTWTGTLGVATSQPMIVVKSVTVKVLRQENISTLNVRITTDIAIKKFAQVIKHDTNSVETFNKNGDSSNSNISMNSSQTPAIRKKLTDVQKENDPVYAEFGDIIIFQMDIENYQDYEVQVQVYDTLPKKVKEIKRNFKDKTWIVIPAGSKAKPGKVTLTLELRVEANDSDLYFNTLELVTKNLKIQKDTSKNVDFIRTTDRRNGAVVNISEIDRPEDIISKEFYKINDYNIVVDKYITEYNHEMIDKNNEQDITQESYTLEERINKDEKTFKQLYPVPVEKGETLVYSIKLDNNSTKSGNNKVATQVRPTEVIDTLDKGLKYLEIKGNIYDSSGNVKIALSEADGDFTISETGANTNKFKITLSDKNSAGKYLILDPSDYIIYEIKVEVIESNMYLNLMENKANIAILTNINNGKQHDEETVTCSTCDGTGQVIDHYPECSTCNGTGRVTEGEKCQTCSGTGKITVIETCTHCNGTGHNDYDENAKLYKCNDCGTIYTEKPSTCKTPITEAICGSTSFDEICTICDKPTEDCSHYEYRCSAGHITSSSDKNGNKCEYGDSCSDKNPTPSFTYVKECNVCGNQITSTDSGEEACEEVIGVEAPEEPTDGEPVEEPVEIKCTGTYEVKTSKCNNCGKQYTGEVDTCTQTLVCGKSLTKYCTKCNDVASKCTHYKYRCTECDTEYDTKPAECNKLIDKECGSPNGFTEKLISDLLAGNNDGFLSEEDNKLLDDIMGECDICNGNGKITKEVDCPNCAGTGSSGKEYETICPDCEGSGTDEKNPVYKTCDACQGHGSTTINAGSDRVVRKEDGSLNRNTGKKEESSDYVRMKDLVISGYVWLDKNRDGYMNEAIGDENDASDNQNMSYNNTNKEGGKKDVVVKLYKVDGNTPTLVRTTKTDERGRYTFSNNYAVSGDNWYQDYKNKCTQAYDPNTTYQRVDKASGKDAYGNYTNNSKYINYYVEFEYDGILYKSTEFYSGMDNLNVDSSSEDYGKCKMLYPIDSNAAEFKNDRETFNKNHEYISYDVAYDVSLQEPKDGKLSFDKTDHTSQLIENESRVMTARSFIKNTTREDLVSQSENPNDWTNNTIVDNSIANTNLLWLFKFGEFDNRKEPDTEYLKYINLGLELREDVDITLTKDVYKVKTTIDGEEMEYTFNQNNGLNGEMADCTYTANDDGEVSTYLNNYISSAPYGLDLYESDYKMRIEQYKAEAVRIYKGIKGESELNAEVTYRITIANKEINDDQTNDPQKTKDTKLGVRISEVLDLYDENFMKVQFNTDGTMVTGAGSANEITVKTKDENGYLVDKNLVIGEAWFFRKIEGTTVAPENRYRLDENSVTPLEYAGGKTIDENGNSKNKPVYIQDPNGEFEKVPLVLRGESYRGENGPFSVKENKNDFSGDGYNTLYITGMDSVLIGEGEDLDIYVKYVLDKESIEMENTNIDFEETSSTSTDTNGTETSITVISESKVKIDRSLKIAERIAGKLSDKNTGTDGTAPNIVARKDSGRGLEGIAQINAYSVWYEDGKEAALVDMDSNAGNLGNANNGLADKLSGVTDATERENILTQDKKDKVTTSIISADEYTYYEDNTYKTGIEITADGTEWTKEQANDKWTGKTIIIITQKDKVIRELSGMIWDDSRSDETVSQEIQYIGDGKYNVDKGKVENAEMNGNIGENYDNQILKNESGKTKLDEQKDLMVRNSRAEIVEIVEIPQGNGKSHYYEQVLTDVAWDQVQHIRTNAKGEYTLTGFVPGKYIVRFTYGDTIKYGANENNPNATLISNKELLALEIDNRNIDDTEKQKMLDMYVYSIKEDEGQDSERDSLKSSAESNKDVLIGNVIKDMQVFNGQDYKSTQFAYEMTDYDDGIINNNEKLAVVDKDLSGTIDNYAINSSDAKTEAESNNTTNMDTVLAALERPNLSDARDDEIRRLEVNNYSEVMINKKAEVLKGLANGTQLTDRTLGTEESKDIYVNYYINDDGTSGNTDAQLTELTDNTYMKSETVEFLVKTEKLTYEQTTRTDNIYHNYIDDKDSKIYYDELKTIEYVTTSEREFKIKNIDMGIEYRPETKINMIKEINNVKLVTSDFTKTLVDLRFYTTEENGVIVHHVDTENSIGAEGVQFITNNYVQSPLLDSLLGISSSEEDQQGFMYVAVDEDILQGCRVIVQYKFTAENLSETDRIAGTLNSMRFYGNDATKDLREKYSTVENVNEIQREENTDPANQNNKPKYEYAANNFARNIVYYDVYSLDDNNDEYRNRPKTMIEEVSTETDLDGTNGYFGKYVGYTYYTGNADNTLDVVSELKFDRIVDYVDTNLDFGQLSQTDTSKLGEDSSNPLSDVLDMNYVGNQNWANNSTQFVDDMKDYIHALNKVENGNTTVLEKVLTNLDGEEYKSLVITTPDRLSETIKDEEDTTQNKEFSRFLSPKVVNAENSAATIYLPVSKTLSSETDTDNMQYENIAEVIQFTVLTGRRTNFKATIGNADIHAVFEQNSDSYKKYGSIEFVTAALESDTSATETITLTPPTGLMRNRRVVYEAVTTTKNVVEVVVIALAVVVIAISVTKFTMVKIKKRRYR